MTKLAITILLVIGSASSQVPGHSWMRVYDGRLSVEGREGRTTVYVASDGIRRRDDGSVLALMTAVFPDGSRFVKPDTDFSETTFEVFFRCDLPGTAKAISVTAYDRRHRRVIAERYSEEAAPEVPGALNHLLYEWICERPTAQPQMPILHPTPPLKIS